MAIEALPASTVERLNSNLTISGPVMLLKELIDNAIDAKATTIEAIVSLNTLDRVEVRDNGVGIHADDYDKLARYSHTSKLRDFEDMSAAGGRSLGFRGLALASASSLGQITITTRTESEPIATVLQIKPKGGGVLSSKPGAAPVGTTVSVTDLYNHIPVRKQHLLKDSIKSLNSMRALIQSFLMSRPHLRFMFKVHKNPGYNWSYMPAQNASLKDTVHLLLGREHTASCFEKRAQYAVSNNVVYTYEAVLSKPDYSVAKKSRARFFSLNGRPLCDHRGTMKKLGKIHSKHVASDANTFLRLDIQCPAHQYDVNIEPAKDDVLFVDETLVLQHFEDFCSSAYAEWSPNPTKGLIQNVACHLTSSDPAPDDLDDLPILQPSRLRGMDNPYQSPPASSPIQRVPHRAPMAPQHTQQQACDSPQQVLNHRHQYVESSQQASVHARGVLGSQETLDQPRFGQERTRQTFRPPHKTPRHLRQATNRTEAQHHSRDLEDGLRQTTLFLEGNRPRINERFTGPSKTVSQTVESLGDMHKLPFPRNKFSTAREYHAQQVQCLPNQDLPSPGSGSHRTTWEDRSGRPLASQSVKLRSFAPQAETHIPAETEPIKTLIPSGDPRAYLLRRQKSMATGASRPGPKKLKRWQSNLLPFEKIPDNARIHCLKFTVNLQSPDLELEVNRIEKLDRYVTEGDIEEGLDMDFGEGRRVETNLNELLSLLAEQLTGEKSRVQSGLLSILKGKGTAADSF